MNPKSLYTIKWTQPYSMTNPFLQNLWQAYEEVIERKLAAGEFTEAKQALERIMKL